MREFSPRAPGDASLGLFFFRPLSPAPAYLQPFRRSLCFSNSLSGRHRTRRDGGRASGCAQDRLEFWIFLESVRHRRRNRSPPPGIQPRWGLEDELTLSSLEAAPTRVVVSGRRGTPWSSVCPQGTPARRPDHSGQILDVSSGSGESHPEEGSLAPGHLHPRHPCRW